MRMGPNTDRVPASVNRYLLPHEHQVVSVHQHPAVLSGRIFVVLVGVVAAVWLSISVAPDNGTALVIIWFLWGLLLAWLAVKVVDWSRNYFVVTSARLLLAQGFIVRKVNMMPLAKVTDMASSGPQWARSSATASSSWSHPGKTRRCATSGSCPILSSSTWRSAG